jgi:pimeloyl-ACP methyl ester carboxylesterase
MTCARTTALAAALLAVATSLGGCATVDGVSMTVVSDRRVELAVSGRGVPAVVFENGLGGRLDWWAKVLPEVAKHTTTFAYNRPGTGLSARAATPRDGHHIIEELRVVLRARNIPPPYVLVGHSLGGLYMQLYARRYPDEVVGLVLVDSTHPDQLKDAGAKENWPSWLKLMFDATSSQAAQDELAALSSTGASVLALPPPSGKPVIVLSARQPMRETSVLARDANAKRIDIVRLHPGAKQVWVDSGHAIPLEKPDAVIEAIREVLAAQPSTPAR